MGKKEHEEAWHRFFDEYGQWLRKILSYWRLQEADAEDVYSIVMFLVVRKFGHPDTMVKKVVNVKSYETTEIVSFGRWW